MQEGLYKIDLHVRQTIPELIKIITPKGIGIRWYGYDTHRNRLAEGTLVTVHCRNNNPDVLCQREYDELLNFVNTKLSVIRDTPGELKQVSSKSIEKIITEINSEEKADKTFNLVENEEDGKVYGQL